MSLDIDRIRADTPGVNSVNHLLACGSALMPTPVVEAITSHIALEARIGGYEAQAQANNQLDGVYDSVAALIGARRQEIALVENATAAWCHAFYALPLRAGDRVLTGEAEYAANYVAFLQRAKRDGIEIDVVPSDESGMLDVAAMEAMIDDRVALIAITWVPTNGGLVNPAKAVGEVARQHAIPYLLDACQAVGQMPVHVDEIGCDFLSATGRKFLRGPRGTGFLYVREQRIESLEPIFIDHFAAPWAAVERYELRADARRFENWENAYALRAGLGAAADYLTAIGIEPIKQRAWHLASGLRERLSTLAGVQLRDIGREQCAIVSFTAQGLEPRHTVTALRKQGINIGASDPASTLLDSNMRGLPTMLRASPHYYNTEAELDALVDALGAMIAAA